MAKKKTKTLVEIVELRKVPKNGKPIGKPVSIYGRADGRKNQWYFLQRDLRNNVPKGANAYIAGKAHGVGHADAPIQYYKI